MAKPSLPTAHPSAPMPPVAPPQAPADQPRRPVAALALALGGLGLMPLLGCQSTPAPPPPAAVQAASLQERAFASTLDTVSTLEANEEVELAAQAGGRVQRLLVRNGDAVRAGQLLLVLDQTQLRAEVASLQAQAERDRLNDQRYELLVRQGAASAIQRDAYRAAAVSSRESLRARQADLAYKDLRAPIDGVVGDLTVKPGDVVQAGTPIGRLIRNQRLLARIDVPTNRAPAVQPGQAVELLDGSGRPVAAGRVESLDPGVSASSQTLLARASIRNPGNLRNGQRLRTRVRLGEERYLALPFRAVTRQSGQAFVFVLAPGRRAVLRPVRLGPLQGADYPLLAGLQPGERVIVSSTLGLRNGVLVRVRGGR